MRWRVVTFVGFFSPQIWTFRSEMQKKKRQNYVRRDCESVWGARWTFSLVHATAVTVTGVTWCRHGGVVLPLPFISASVFKLVVVVVVDLQKPFKRDCTHTHKYKTQNNPPPKKEAPVWHLISDPAYEQDFCLQADCEKYTVLAVTLTIHVVFVLRSISLCFTFHSLRQKGMNYYPDFLSLCVLKTWCNITGIHWCRLVFFVFFCLIVSLCE